MRLTGQRCGVRQCERQGGEKWSEQHAPPRRTILIIGEEEIRGEYPIQIALRHFGFLYLAREGPDLPRRPIQTRSADLCVEVAAQFRPRFGWIASIEAGLAALLASNRAMNRI
jgi:hypothetical protein